MKSPLQAMRDLLCEDTRYKIEAYQFIREALQYAHENLIPPADDLQSNAEESDKFEPTDFDAAEFETGDFDESAYDPKFDAADFDTNDLDSSEFDATQGRPQHVTGQQLCEACRQYAIDQYGYLAGIVLASWGIHSTSDLGELVYNLIRIEQMRKSDSDRREDFDDVYDFENAFDPKFELAFESET